MWTKTFGASHRGAQALPVSVEIRTDRGFRFHVTGLPSGAARDAALRIRSALLSSGCRWPRLSCTVNLSPAVTATEAAAFDLPIALALLAASEQVPVDRVKSVCSMGELRLDGSIGGDHPSYLAAPSAALEVGCTETLLPAHAAVSGGAWRPAVTLREVVRHLRGDVSLALKGSQEAAEHPEREVDLADLTADRLTRLLLVAAAAGHHHVLILGPPGSGKSTFLRCLHGLLPCPQPRERATNERFLGLRGLPPLSHGAVPLRTPHPTTTPEGMLGAFPSSSSSGLIPGEMSLAHGGMLCLDELAEFPRNVLESLRGPLESGEVHLSRAGGVARIPMACIVGASANPCPCGFLGEGPARCRCSISDIEKGFRRLSGPLIDRFPIHLETALFPQEDGNLPRWLTHSHEAAEAIREVRSIGADAGTAPPPAAEGREFLRALRHNVGCSERGRNSVLAVSRTLLALDRVTSGGVFIGAEREDLERSALLTAAQCRIFDRTSWIEGARKRNSHRHERNRIELPRLHTPHS